MSPSLLLPLSLLALARVANSQLDTGLCEAGRTCVFMKECAGQMSAECRVAFSYKLNEETMAMEMELAGYQASGTARYIAVAFSNGGMANSFVSECSSMGDAGPLSVKLSYNNENPTNVRIANAESVIAALVTQELAKFEENIVYCRWTQSLQPNASVLSDAGGQVFHIAYGNEYNILLAYGEAAADRLRIHNGKEVTVTTNFTGEATAADDSKTRLIKAHGSLMIIAWLVAIPSAALFARFLRGHWPTRRPFGLAIWFHVHRMANTSGLLLMVAALVCVLCATNWTWTGVQSSASYWVVVHSTIGIISLVLAWLQPFIALLRCDPQHPRRVIFNWIHRCIGLTAFILAVTCIAIAGDNFSIWNQHTLTLIVSLLPLVIIEALLLITWVIERRMPQNKDNIVKVQRIRLALVLVFIGLLVACAVCLVVVLAIA